MTTSTNPALHAESDSGRDGIKPCGTELDDVAAPAVACAEQLPHYWASRRPPGINMGEPGELITAVPALVGFAPQRSLVVLLLRDIPDRADLTAIDAVVRLDLDEDGRRVRAVDIAARVAQMSVREGAREVLAVVVDDRATDLGCRSGGSAPSAGRFEALTGLLARRLAACDVLLGGVWAVRAIEREQHWWSLLGADQHGTLPDPAASMVTMRQVLDGRPIRGSRQELTDLVAVDAELSAQVANLLDGALAVARDRYAAAVRRGDPNHYSRQALERVLGQIANTESGQLLAAPELAELAAALRDRAVRDTMFALAVGDHAAAAERLWITMVRALSGADRAEAAALLGYSAYVRGDGPFAGIALEAALEADPSHPIAILLETSLRAGMRPEKLRRLARCGGATATDLGVDIGPTGL